MTINIGIVVAAIGVLASIFGVLIGYNTYLKNSNKECKLQGHDDGELKSDMEYIKRRIDEMLLNQLRLHENISDHAIKIAKLEEAVKSAHHRLDEHILKRRETDHE